MKTIMEKILGGKIQSTAEIGINGLQGTNDSEVIFFEVPDAEQPAVVFRRLTNATDPPNAQNGGASEYGCSIRTPENGSYHALIIHGDLDGWRKDIELGARQLDLSLAKVCGDTLVLDGDHKRPIADCDVEFF